MVFSGVALSLKAACGQKYLYVYQIIILLFNYLIEFRLNKSNWFIVISLQTLQYLRTYNSLGSRFFTRLKRETSMTFQSYLFLSSFEFFCKLKTWFTRMLVKYLECFVSPMLLPVMISHCTNYWSTTTIATVLTLLMTAIFAIADNILNQIPMSCALCATGRRKSHTILSESMRISKMLLARAKNGARGKAATKIVTKPNWMPGKK